MTRCLLHARWLVPCLASSIFFLNECRPADDALPAQEANTWVKRTPLKNKPAPPIGYESAFAWDPKHKVLIRMAAHAIDGFEQLAEVWTLDPLTGEWKLKEPNTSPPGACRLQQHVFDTLHNRYLRFPGTSGDHGWQWYRELYMNEGSVWAYDLETNTWRAMRPWPEPMILRQHFASWDGKLGKAVVFGGSKTPHDPETTSAGFTCVYDARLNTWEMKKAPGQPDSRVGGNMAWCAATGQHVMFGSEQAHKGIHGYDIAKKAWSDIKPDTLPPTTHNEAVMAYDSLNDTLLCVVIDREGKEMEKAMTYNGKRHLETWAFNPAKSAWKKMAPASEPDPGAIRCRMLAYAPELNLAFLDVCESHPSGGGAARETQVWSYRLAASTKKPPEHPKRNEPLLVDELTASVVSPKEIKLKWKAAAGEIKGYVVERAPVEVCTEDELRHVKSGTPPLKEPAVAAIKAIGEFTAVTEAPITEATFTDKGIDLSKPQAIAGKKTAYPYLRQDHIAQGGKKYRYGVYAYRVRTMGKDGTAGGPSPYVLTIPSSPTQVFSKEGGGNCAIKWSANPETNIAGYRVYRVDGPRTKSGTSQKVERLTADPIKGTTYTDKPGEKEHRYYIIAVDSLGQEGYPSSPVWSNRRKKDLYTRFTGEWHQ